jgi:hypothetical protein
MSNFDPMMKASTQSGPETKPIEACGGGFNAAPRPSKSDRAAGEAEMRRSTVSAFPSKPALSACRPPLFRR